MSKLKYLLLGFLVLFFCLALFVFNLPSGQTRAQKQKRQDPDFERFPVVDFLGAEPTDPVQRAKREKRGKRHNIKYAPRVDQIDKPTFLIIDWDVNLPALPVNKSAAVIIGKINKAEAQVSEDKTGVYSEFIVNIEAILKNDTKSPLHVDNSLSVLRIGGRVRLPSGQIILSGVINQDMPQTGSRYVLFLTHNSLMGGEDEDFYILTGYELKNGKAFPLDKVSTHHPIQKYTDVSETVLLTDLSAALGTASLPRK